MGFIVKKEHIWPKGIIYYKFTTDSPSDAVNVPKEYRELIRSCMTTWEECVNGAANERLIEFRLTDGSAKYYYRIEKADLNKGQTTAGSVGLTQAGAGKNGILFTIRFDRDIGSIPHELAHCIGIAHENERNAPSKFDQLPKDPPHLCYYTDDESEKKNMLSTWSRFERNASKYLGVGAYDTKSITHYPKGDGRKWNVEAYNSDKDIGAGKLKESELLNQPSEEQVKNQTWRPSKGDIEAAIAIYEG